MAVGTGLLVVALAFLDDVQITTRLIVLVGGCALLFVGIALLSPRLVGRLAVVIGWPAAIVGGAPGRLARHNSQRNPGRVATTAAALMIGLALVTFVAVLGAGLREANETAIDRQFDADYVVSAQSGETFETEATDTIEKAAGVEAASGVRSDSARPAGSDSAKNVTGIDPRTITGTYRFDWSDGSDDVLGRLRAGDALISKDFAKAEGLERGDRFRMVTPSNETIEHEVSAIHRSRPLAPLLGDVTVSHAGFDRDFDRTLTQYAFVRVTGGAGRSSERALERALEPFPDAKLETKAGFIDEQGAPLATLLNLVFLLLALAIVVSLFGIVNTLALSVFERTREVGMLRAVGMVPSQVRWMVLHESVIIALLGGVLGTAVGLFLGALISQALTEYDLEFQLPLGYLATFLLVALVAGVLASILPARRAARLNVLEALHYE